MFTRIDALAPLPDVHAELAIGAPAGTRLVGIHPVGVARSVGVAGVAADGVDGIGLTTRILDVGLGLAGVAGGIRLCVGTGVEV